MPSSRTATESALGALGRRDLSAAQLERKLEAKGFSEAERDEALATLERTGLLDDVRYASTRAASLAARGAGDALIRADLERAGVDREAANTAIDELEPEALRARRIVERRGRSPKTWRYLAGKGFSQDAIERTAGKNDDCC